MITDDARFYLPNLYTFQNGNAFYGSFRGLRFFVEPVKQDHESLFSCKVWRGERCLEESTVEAEESFPLDESGYAGLLQWLDAQYRASEAPSVHAPDGFLGE